MFVVQDKFKLQITATVYAVPTLIIGYSKNEAAGLRLYSLIEPNYNGFLREKFSHR